MYRKKHVPIDESASPYLSLAELTYPVFTQMPGELLLVIQIFVVFMRHPSSAN